MTQAELNAAVARATGESLGDIVHHGFGLADPDVVDFDPEPLRAPLWVDWDEVDQMRSFAAV